MKLPTSHFFLLVSLLLWNILLRYPNIDGPHDGDGQNVMSTASIINNLGVNNLLLSPLSYFGMYPFSKPYATHTFLAAFVQISNLNMDIAVYIICIVYMLIALISIYLVTYKITGQSRTSLLSILFLTTSSYFTNYTFWTISPRGPFMAFLPLFLLVLIRVPERDRRINLMEIIVAFLLLILLMTTHRMYTFVAVTIIFPFLIFLLLTQYIQSKQLVAVYSRKIYQYLLLGFSILLIFIAIFVPSFYNVFGVPVSHFWIREKFDFQYIGPLLNVIFTYVSTNPLLIFTALGAFTLIYYPFIRFHHRYLLLVLLFSMPFIVNYEYFYPVLLTILCILGGIGLHTFLSFVEKVSTREKSFTLLKTF